MALKTIENENSICPANPKATPEKNGNKAKAINTPIAAPIRQRNMDSIKTNTIISVSEFPIDLSTPNSFVLSRTAWLIVFAVNKRIVKKEAAKTELMMNPISPTCSANILLNASSVEVLVSSGEQVACSLIAGCLIDKGLKSRSWLAWQLPIITEGPNKNARISRINKVKIVIIRNSKV